MVLNYVYVIIKRRTIEAKPDGNKTNPNILLSNGQRFLSTYMHQIESWLRILQDSWYRRRKLDTKAG